MVQQKPYRSSFSQAGRSAQDLRLDARAKIPVCSIKWFLIGLLCFMNHGHWRPLVRLLPAEVCSTTVAGLPADN
jgi:hypothetical protein